MRALSIVLLTLTLLAFVHAEEQNCGDIVLYSSTVDPYTASCTTATSVKASNTQLSSLELPKLTTVTGSISIQQNRNLNSIVMPNLVSIGSGLYIQMNPSLSWIQLNSLDYVYDFEFLENSKVDLEFRSLSHVYMMNIGNGANSVTFPHLTAVTYSAAIYSNVLTSVTLPNLATISQFTLSNTQYVGSISLPALTTASSLEIRSNANLATIDCPHLVSLSYLNVQSNPVLSTIYLTSLQTLGQVSLQTQVSPHLYIYSCQARLKASYGAICSGTLNVPSLAKLLEARRLAGCATGMHLDEAKSVCVHDTVA